MEKTSLLLRLPKSLKKKLEKVASEKGISTTGLILVVLDNYVKETA